MNFLAHLFLSNHDDQLAAGNFIADWVKGKQWENYPEGIARGILHHRFIDNYTDQHPVSRDLTAHLRESQSKYAPVALDLIYDHLLASNFKLYSIERLDWFVQRMYNVLEKQKDLFPKNAIVALDHMTRHNWLEGYATLEGITIAFRGLSGRAVPGNNLQAAPSEITRLDRTLFTAFNSFFPDLQMASATFLGSSRN